MGEDKAIRHALQGRLLLMAGLEASTPQMPTPTNLWRSQPRDIWRDRNQQLLQ